MKSRIFFVVSLLISLGYSIYHVDTFPTGNFSRFFSYDIGLATAILIILFAFVLFGGTIYLTSFHASLAKKT